MNVIEAQKLTKYYLGHKVLGVRDLNLKVVEGEVFGFIGPNGAGKTTTIRLLLDLIRPTAGSAKIFDLDVNKDSVAVHQKIGYLPGEIFLPENMTGQSCLDYYGGFKNTIDKKFVAEIIARFDLNLSKQIKNYSKGNRQKLAILLAVMHKPKLLILDEPTSGLDPLNQREFYNLVVQMKELGTTVFLSTHILDEAQRVCDRVAIIKEGKILTTENIDELREKNVRTIRIETRDSLAASEFSHRNIDKFEKIEGGYSITVTGHIGEIVKKIAGYDIIDLRISEPSLEDIFLHYYSKDEK